MHNLNGAGANFTPRTFCQFYSENIFLINSENILRHVPVHTIGAQNAQPMLRYPIHVQCTLHPSHPVALYLGVCIISAQIKLYSIAICDAIFVICNTN